MNLVELDGLVEGSPKVQNSKNGQPYTTFKILNNGKVFEFIAFGHASRNAAGLKQGEYVRLLGELSTRSYVDKNGNQRSNNEVRVSNVQKIEDPLPRQTHQPVIENSIDPMDGIPF